MPRSHRLRRLVVGVLLAAGVPLLAYSCWSPGSIGPLPRGAHDGVWLTHAWWGDDEWFAESTRRVGDYRGADAVARVAARLHAIGCDDWYVHAGPARGDGSLPAIDLEQARLLVAANRDGQVLAWVGGVLDVHCFPSRPVWRSCFAAACRDLVDRAGIAGIQLNIEPCPDGAEGFIALLDELRTALRGKRLSIAAYPPHSFLHPAAAVHWSEATYRAVSARCDDLCVMAYDTALRVRKPYTWLVARWTRQTLAWSSAPVRIGVPAYDDAGVGYHDPRVENLATALPGVAAGLTASDDTSRFAGIAVYAEWTMREGDDATLAGARSR